MSWSPYPTSLDLNCPPTSEEPTRTGQAVCEEDKRGQLDLACSCFGGLKTRRGTKLSALWWLAMSFKAGDTIFAIKYGRLASSERCPTANQRGSKNAAPRHSWARGRDSRHGKEEKQ